MVSWQAPAHLPAEGRPQGRPSPSCVVPRNRIRVGPDGIPQGAIDHRNETTEEEKVAVKESTRLASATSFSGTRREWVRCTAACSHVVRARRRLPAARIMAARHVHSVLVISEDGSCSSIVTAAGLAEGLEAGAIGAQTADEITAAPVAVGPLEPFGVPSSSCAIATRHIWWWSNLLRESRSECCRFSIFSTSSPRAKACDAS